ncbi:hypothetical protein [Streptomyces blastmyceticus]|uniref:Uncharacterized protein n=1 Tax=Streptomyces blastmyceticus TaxID=68180 RepID=A0ABN0Y1E0_9ACTN
MTARHARPEGPDKIDLGHPARSFIALLAVAVAVSAGIVLNGHGDTLLDDSESAPTLSMTDTTSAN